MARPLLNGAAALLLLAACQQTAVVPPSRANLSDALVRMQDGPPDGPEGACWASDVTPAVIETLTEQVMTSPEIRDASGALTAPASFRSVSQHRMVQDREEVWFRAPCPDELTVDFIASVQRALKARGLYLAPVSGVLDPATAEAIRRFQADRGLDSPTLSLAATRDLGISQTDLSAL